MYHTIILAGNVGSDPSMRYTPSGQPVTTFSVATNRQYTASNGKTVKETLWARVTTWGKTAEVCNQYVKKGSKVLVEGILRPDPATGSPKVYDKQDGSKGSSYEVTANTVRFLSGKDGDHSEHASQGNDFAGTPEEDIPF